MTLATEADRRLAQMRRDLQKMVVRKTQEHTERIFVADDEFYRNADVIPIRAVLIGQIVRSAQQLIVTNVNAQLGRKVGLSALPPVSPTVFDRPGVTKDAEYARPFHTALQLVQGGKSQAEATTAAVRRMHLMTATDVQMAKIRQARIVLKAGGRPTFRRVPTSENPCELCDTVSDQIYYTDDLMPIHVNCSCDIEPDEAPDMSEDEARATYFGSPGSTDEADEADDEDSDEDKSQRKIEVREHGEIGPVLTWADQQFTGPDDLPNPPDVIANAQGGLQRNRLAS